MTQQNDVLTFYAVITCLMVDIVLIKFRPNVTKYYISLYDDVDAT